MKKKISIVIAVYNISSYIERCLDSVIKQKGDEIEILIIDDGSTDNSLDICKKYQKKDKRIKIFHQENKGLCAVRNIGLEKATGEYIWHIDGDDYIEDNSIDILRKYIDKYDIICFNFYKDIDGKLNKVKIKDISCYDNIYDKYILSYTAVWNKVIKREVLESELFPVGNSYNDVYVIPTLVKKTKKIIFLDDYLYYYVHRKSSLSNTRKFNLKDRLECLDHVYDTLKDEYYDAAVLFYINELLIFYITWKIEYKRNANFRELNKVLKEKFPKYYKCKYWNTSLGRKIYIRLAYCNMFTLVKFLTYLKMKVFNS